MSDPIIHNPIRTAADVERCGLFDPRTGSRFVMDAIRHRQPRARRQAGVIGFSGAPFTLACYLIEGRPSRDLRQGKVVHVPRARGVGRPDGEAVEVVVRYLRAQVDAGAQVVQLFDSLGRRVASGRLRALRAAARRAIFAALEDVPTIHFGAIRPRCSRVMAEAGGDVISIDAHQSLDVAWATHRLRPRRPGQPGCDTRSRRLGRDRGRGARRACGGLAGDRATSSTWATASCPSTDPGHPATPRRLRPRADCADEAHR